MHDSTAVHLHIIQQSTVLQAIWFAAEKANSSWIPAWQGDCAWNHAKHMSSWLDVHSSMRYTHGGECIFYVCICASVSMCVLDRGWRDVDTFSLHWDHVAFGPEWLAAVPLPHTYSDTIFYYQQFMECLIMTMSLKNMQNTFSGKRLSFKPVCCIVYIYIMDSAKSIIDYITLKNSLHLFTGICIISNNKCNTWLNIFP